MPDAVLAIVLAAVLLADVFLAAADATAGASGQGTTAAGGSVLGAGLLDAVPLVAGALLVVARRRAPRVVLVATTLCVLVASLRTAIGPAATVPVMIALYTTLRAGHRVFGVAVVAPVLVGSLAAGVATHLTSSEPGAIRTAFQDAILPLGWFVAAGVMGEVARQRRAYLDQVEQRAVEAERTREETARRRAGEERLRIARELHDSLTHSISVIKVQAGVAVHLARKRGEDVPEALLAIQEASRDAMRELRAALEVLRHDPAEPDAATLGRLDALVARARSVGLATTVRVTSDPRVLPPEVDRAAYRIIQEALTNVTRHAGAASATVTVDVAADRVVVGVDDDGQARPDQVVTPGVGLTGMRERVTALGGTLRAEPRPNGGFGVRAELPLPSATRTPEAAGAEPVHRRADEDVLAPAHDESATATGPDSLPQTRQENDRDPRPAGR